MTKLERGLTLKYYKYGSVDYIDIENEEAALIIKMLKKSGNFLLENFSYIFNDTHKYISELSIKINKSLLVYKEGNKFAEIYFYLKNNQLYIDFCLEENILRNYELMKFKLAYLKDKSHNIFHKLFNKDKNKIISEFNETVEYLENEFEILYATIHELITRLIISVFETNLYVQRNINLKLNFFIREMYKNLNLSKFYDIKNKKALNNYDKFFKENNVKSKEEKLFFDSLFNFLNYNKKYRGFLEYHRSKYKSVSFLHSLMSKNESETLSYDLYITFFNKEFMDKYKLSKFEPETKEFTYYFKTITEYTKMNDKSEDDLFLIESILAMVNQTTIPRNKIKYYYSLFNNDELFYTYNNALLNTLEFSIREKMHISGNFYFQSKDEIVYQYINKDGSNIDLIIMDLKNETIYFTENYYFLKETELIYSTFYNYHQIILLFDKIQKLFNGLEFIGKKKVEEKVKDYKRIKINNTILFLREI